MVHASRSLRWFVSGFLLFWAFVVLFPLYWTFTISLKDSAGIFGGASFIPWVDFEPTLDAWRRVFLQPGGTLLSLSNSAIIGVISAAFATITGGLAGYGLSRFRYKFGPLRNRDIAFWILSQRMLPPVVVVLPLFVMFSTVGLIDSRFGMILLYTMFNLPIAAWLMYQYFTQIPLDLDEAARIDGATDLQVFRHVALPLARPGLVATFIVSLVFAWNEFLFALIFTFSQARTMPILVAGQATQHGPQWWDIAVMALITVAPLVLITALLGRRLLGDILAGWGK
ncbi:carbohydrate ABC transporter permease [Rubrobacter taiwanensis]|jgi:multiple sugar transport system permease protein|nr:carbohydrate ABC transporter permease [Rubrobacter taiwanensis]